MTTPSVRNHQQTARVMMIVTLGAGITGFLYQLIQDGSMLTFLVTMSAIGGLAASSKTFDERESQLLWHSYANAFEGLIIAVYLAFALIMLSNSIHIGVEITSFLNAHWPSMIASVMCILLGIVGLRNFREIR